MRPIEWGPAVLLGVVCFTASPGAAVAQERRISGIVVDSAGAPVAHVNVFLSSKRTVSSDSGTFTLAGAPVEEFAIEARRIGYRSEELRVPAGSDTSVRIVLVAVARQLSRVEVTGTQTSAKLELRGFYDRMRDVERGINRGYFITPEDLERRRPSAITQMVENFPSIRVTGRSLIYAQILGTGGCRMTVYLDGIRVVGALNARMDEQINTLVKPNEVAGIEVYPRAVQAPPKYQGLNGSCGVVLIWTR